MAETDRISSVEIKLDDERRISEQVDRDLKIAIFELCQQNSFVIVPRKGRTPPSGPYRLYFSLENNYAVFEIRFEDGSRPIRRLFSMSRLRPHFKDYAKVCQNYFDAVHTMPASELEQFDMYRTIVHNEGADILREQLKHHFEMDQQTARQLFTLLYAAVMPL